MAAVTDLAILGILNEAPMHGYQIRFLIERRMKDYANVHFASIYHALGKYEKNGWVVLEGVERTNAAPERRRYRITEEGRRQFRELLLDQLSAAQSYQDPLGVCLSLLHNLSLEEVLGPLKARLERLQNEVKTVRSEQERVAQIPQAGGAVELAFRHVLVHLEAEIAWLTETIEALPQQKRWMEGPQWADL